MPIDINGLEVTNDIPTVDEYLRLRKSGDLKEFAPKAAQAGLQGTLFAVTLRLNGLAIGMGRIIGDGGCFFEIVDIVVDPAFRGHGLGKTITAALVEYADTHLPETAYLSLYADVPANALYAQFGFEETAPNTLGMARNVRRGK